LQELIKSRLSMTHYFQVDSTTPFAGLATFATPQILSDGRTAMPALAVGIYELNHFHRQTKRKGGIPKNAPSLYVINLHPA
jgi:hypothetical protein